MKLFTNLLKLLRGQHAEAGRSPLQVVARRNLQSREGAEGVKTGDTTPKRVARVTPGDDNYTITP